MKKCKSIAVSDNVFLNSYFTKVIGILELQHEVEKLRKIGRELHGQILEMTYSEFNAQNKNDTMMDESKPSRILRRAGKTARNTIVESDIVIPKKKLNLFPYSIHHLLLSHFYLWFKAWYEHMLVVPSTRTEEDNS